MSTQDKILQQYRAYLAAHNECPAYLMASPEIYSYVEELCRLQPDLGMICSYMTDGKKHLIYYGAQLVRCRQLGKDELEFCNSINEQCILSDDLA